jgi:beta-lactamase class A
MGRMAILFCSAAVLLFLGQAEKSAMPAKSIESVVRSFAGEAGVFAMNLRTGEEIAINPDMRFPTASTIKTAVMLEVYHQAAEGTLSLDEVLPVKSTDRVGGSGVLNGMSPDLALEVRDLVHLMIVLSDNTATNVLVNRVGTKRIDDRLVGLGLKETKIFRPTFRDGKPDIHPELEKEFGLGMSTPREMARLMAMIARGKAVNREASHAMLATLRRQQDRAMLPRLLPPGIQTGNKTGTDSEKLPDSAGHRGAIRVDAAIIEGQGAHYVIAVFTRRGKDTQGGVDNAGVLLGARIARLVHDAWADKANASPSSK